MADPLGESLLLQLFGIKNPALRILDFFLDNPGSDFSKTEIASGAEISRSTLFAVWPKLQSLELVIMTREIGHARMFRLNKKSPIVKKLVELDDAISAFYLAGSRGREDRILQGADESYPLRDYFHPAQIDLI